MSVTVHPGPVEGALAAPGSKSVTHRALVGALMAGGGSVLEPLWSDDTDATLRAIEALGAQTVTTKREAVVRGEPIRPAEIDCANSGTTLRLTTAIAALADGKSTLTGDDSLLERPVGALADALDQLGAKTRTRADGRPPVEVTGPATGGTAQMPGDVSSQFVSALLMAAPSFEEGLTLELTTPLKSAPYVDLTIDVLDRHGIEVDREDDTFRVEPAVYDRIQMPVPGDYSSAAFPLVAGAIAEGPVTVTNLPDGSVQGDRAIVDMLETFGVAIDREADTVRVEGGELAGAKLDLGDNPDLFPPLAVLAAASEGETILKGAPHLRDKESDRIEAMVDGLTALGVEAKEREDGAEIVGGPIEGGRVDSRGDHRIQMAFAVAGLAAEGPVTIEGPDEAHAVSFPDFLDVLEDLGAQLERSDDQAKEVTST